MTKLEFEQVLKALLRSLPRSLPFAHGSHCSGWRLKVGDLGDHSDAPLLHLFVGTGEGKGTVRSVARERPALKVGRVTSKREDKRRFCFSF